MTTTVNTSLKQTASIELNRTEVLALRAMAVRCTRDELADTLASYLPHESAKAIATLIDTLAWASWNDLTLIASPQEPEPRPE